MFAKAHLPFLFSENEHSRSLIHFLDAKLRVPSRRHLVSTILPEIFFKKTNKDVVQSVLKSCSHGTLGIDLWTSVSSNDIFGLVWHCIDEEFGLHEICLGLIETVNTRGKLLKRTLNENCVILVCLIE